MSSNKLIAFHGDVNIKKKYLKRVKDHAKADEIVKGRYWEFGKGCAVGCTIHGREHARYESELGIPRILARLEDGIFEDLPNDLAMKWPTEFLKAINIGADLSMVWAKFAYWLLIDKKYGVLQFAKSDKSKNAILGVSDLYKKWIDTGIKPNFKNAAAYAAADAADAAAADAYAYAYAYAAAADAAAADAYAYAYAYAAADAADAAAADAADAAAADAAAADAAAAARYKWRIAQSKKLIQLMKACKGNDTNG